MRKTLKELNLLDDFLFGTLLTYPELGEKFSRVLLQTIFQREFGKLTVIPQKIYYGSDTDQHGARLDVYMEEEDAARVSSVYDVEPDQPHGRLNKETAPRRLRFYHALIDSQCLKSGESYLALKNVIVIMMTSLAGTGWSTPSRTAVWKNRICLMTTEQKLYISTQREHGEIHPGRCRNFFIISKRPPGKMQ